MGFLPIKTWLLIACDTAFYAIIVVYQFSLIESISVLQLMGGIFIFIQALLEPSVSKKRDTDRSI